MSRLRKARDEAYEWYLEAFDCYEEGIKEKEEAECVNAELKNRLSETASASSSSPTYATKVSRKEESKVNVPPWPKVSDLGLWKANLIQAIVIAANDPDQQPWIDWVKEAIDDPDPDKLIDSGDPRFHSIDAKLGLALTTVVADSKEEGNNVAMKLRTRINAKGRTSTLIKGREILALILLNFKTTSNVEVPCTSTPRICTSLNTREIEIYHSLYTLGMKS